MEKLKKLGKLSKLVKIISLVLFALFFYFAGFLVGHKNLIFEKNLKPKIVNKEIFKPREVDFGIFWQAWNKIVEDYAGPKDYQKMIYGAVSGLVQSLDDPYSVFMEPGYSKMFLEDLSGEIQGIGAELSVKDGILTIVSPLSGSPAEKAGLKPNDMILKINEDLADNLSFTKAVGLIRGQAGSKVKLTIMRQGWTEPQVFEIQREKITIKSVEWSAKSDNVYYIKVSQFGDDTMGLLNQAVKEISLKDPKAVILDLRNNPGGYLEAAVQTVGLFADKNTVVVKEKDKNEQITEEKTDTDPILGKTKLIILINGGSASASEIVAGALQDMGRATLVGEKSFGKGSVQKLEDLGNDATLRLTIAEWLTPKNRAINHKGIEPDIKVELTEENNKAGVDSQLDKAMELAK